ncbi:MAG: hypothetical protein HFE35_00135 [Clostridia bacterium]|jgi:hypothetical protein|nr:hypothetical protein [Clostridia bacterium]
MTVTLSALLALFLLSPMFLIVFIAIACGSVSENKSGDRIIPPCGKTENNVANKFSERQTLVPAKKATLVAERADRLVPPPNPAFAKCSAVNKNVGWAPTAKLVPPAKFAQAAHKPLSARQIRFMKTIRVLSVILGVLCALAVFTISACTFFGSNAAMRYIELQLERYHTVRAVKGYMAASFVCMALSAVCVMFTFVSFSELCKVGEAGGSLALFFALHIPLILWAAFFRDSSLSQCLVTVIISTVFLCIYAVLMLYFVVCSKKRTRESAAKN